MTIEYIDLIDTGPKAEFPPYTRKSALEITDAGLCVIGNLPHGYVFNPATARDRDNLVNFLQGIEYTETETRVNKKMVSLSDALVDIARGIQK